jgi:hypothetical protein
MFEIPEEKRMKPNYPTAQTFEEAIKTAQGS